MLDIATCAVAFCQLRMNGYDESSGTQAGIPCQCLIDLDLTVELMISILSTDALSHVAEHSSFHNSLLGYLSDTKSTLELFKASKVSISENESIPDSIGYSAAY